MSDPNWQDIAKDFPLTPEGRENLSKLVVMYREYWIAAREQRSSSPAITQALITALQDAWCRICGRRIGAPKNIVHCDACASARAALAFAEKG